MLTEEEKKKREEAAAKLLQKMEAFLDADGGFEKFDERVKALETSITGFKGLDASEVAKQLEGLKAGQQKLTDQIRSSRNGLYVSGLEDEKFSVLNAMVAVRTNDWSSAGLEKEIMDQTREKAGINAGDDVSGRYFIPDQVIADVIGPIYTRSAFINLGAELGDTRISVLDGLTGGTVKVPKFDGGLIAYWIGEEDEYVESLTTVGDMTMKPNKLGVLVRITDTMRRFAGYGYENMLRTDMIRAVAKKVDWTVAYGPGSDNAPRGIVNNNQTKVFLANDSASTNTMYQNLAAIEDAGITATGGQLNFDTLEEMNLALEEDNIELDESSAWISARRSFSRLRRQKTTFYSGQTDGQGYVLGQPMITDQRLKDLIGPYGWTTQIPSNHNAGAGLIAKTDTSADGKCSTMFGGNLSNVVFGRWQGIEIEDDAGRGKGFTSDHLYMKLRMYADVGIRQGRGVFWGPDIIVRD